jgi:poly(hydroxyalkanoate) granule-associated protein
MAKQKTTGANGVPLAEMIRNSANQIWLAGLGALAHAEHRGADWFESLIAAGDKLERAAREQIARPMRLAERRVSETRDSIGETWSTVAVVVERRVAKLLNSMQIPTSRDIDELTRRVAELQEALQALERSRPAARRTQTRRSAGSGAKKKTGARKKRATTRTGGAGRAKKAAQRTPARAARKGGTSGRSPAGA